jgi:hypothetical protein
MPPPNGSYPEFTQSPTPETPGHRRGTLDQPTQLPMAVFRLLAAVLFLGGFLLAGAQVYRVLDGQTRSLTLSWGSLAIGVLCVAAILTWTYATVENSRRILSPAETQELPSPRRAVVLWAVPLAFIVPAAAVVMVLSRRWNNPAEGTSSSVPLLVAFAVILISLILLYAPLASLASVVRKVGGQSGNLLQWAWVPAVLAAVSVATVVGLRAFGTFEGNEDGVAPSWVIAVLLLLPIVVVFFVGHNSAYGLEGAVSRAFDRRVGRAPSLGTHNSTLLSLFGGERPNRTALSVRGPIKLLPAANALRLGVATSLAGIALLNLVGAIVMFLFWRESGDGLLLPSQSDRAWDMLIQLQRAERAVALILVAVVMIWAFVTVYNVRVASGRRRNPLLAAVAWPIAVAGLWIVGLQVTDTSEAEILVAVFFVQAAIAYVPFFFLERAATAIGARRSPIRIVYALSVVMLVYVHGLGGLSTFGAVAEADRFGQIASYLALGALVLLLSTLAVTEASRTISDACEHEAEHHNFLLGQRQAQEPRTAPTPAGPNIAVD